MKIAIIGGAGTRVPLLTNGLLRFRSDLPTAEISLWDIDHPRRERIALIARSMAQLFGVNLRVSTPESLEEVLCESTFVISSIRVGGSAGRILDERIALSNGTVGQETVGAGGFSLSLRTIPVMLAYAKKVSLMAPRAWLLNFTNPVGIISEAFIRAGLGDRTIGICDTPREQFECLAHALDVSLDEAYFDYFGLNHLGWIKRIFIKGEDCTKKLFKSPERLLRSYRIPLFEAEFLRDLGVIPTEYLYFYYRSDRAFRRTEASGKTRGEMVQTLEKELMRQVQQHSSNPEKIVEAYDEYLSRRNASYMTVETGERIVAQTIHRAREQLYQQAAGYERIAIDVMRAIHKNQPAVMPVNVANQGAIEVLEDRDAVEVLCAIDSNGAHPLAAGRIPEKVKNLIVRVKEYERLTVQASLGHSADLAEKALERNPIIQNRNQARAIMVEYREVHQPYLNYLT